MSFVSPGLILRGIDYGESDRILSVFTSSHGKLSVFVPGARRSKKRFAQALDLFCRMEGEYHARKGSSLLRLGDFDYIDVGIRLRHDLGHIIYATLFTESLLKLTVEHDPHPELYALAEEFLDALAETKLSPQRIDLPIYQLRLLALLGFLPELTRCVRCANPFNPSGERQYYFFVPHEGGVICRRCLPQHPYAPSIDNVALKAVDATLKNQVAVSRLRLPPDAALNLHHVVFEMIESISGTELKSRRLFPLIFEKKETSHAQKTPHATPGKQEVA